VRYATQRDLPPDQPVRLPETMIRRRQSWPGSRVREGESGLDAAKPATVWFTGLVGAGETTLSRLVAEELATRTGQRALILDGDGLSSGLGFSESDRGEQARRAAHLAALAAQSGLVALVALVSPFARAGLVHVPRPGASSP
jgi:adenylylsulfate kinase-like enzyme